VNLFVDTSVWSLAFRRTPASGAPEVDRLRKSLEAGDLIVTTGLVIQELLQGFDGPRDRDRLLEEFSALPCLMPEVEDHVQAALLRNRCRRKGIQVGTIDALIAQLCIRNDLEILTADRDFRQIARHCPLDVASV